MSVLVALDLLTKLPVGSSKLAYAQPEGVKLAHAF